MYTGEVFEIAPTRREGDILSFENLPYSDYPRVLADRNALIVQPQFM